MNRTFIKLINQLAVKPKNLFFIDGVGAGITALVLLFIVLNLSTVFGMPKTTLIVLSLIAVCFCVYALSCFVFLKDKWVFFIRILSIANLLYCLLTLSLVLIHCKELPTLGTVYFVVEIAIIVGLVYIELQVVNRIVQIKGATRVHE